MIASCVGWSNEVSWARSLASSVVYDESGVMPRTSANWSATIRAASALTTCVRTV